MREFAFGTDQQYIWLENFISDGQCHVFNNSVLPDTCTPNRCRLGFEKTDGTYIAYVDRGISTTSDNKDFVRFLQQGESRFVSMNEMAEFFRSFQTLFTTYDVETLASTEDSIKHSSTSGVVDMAALVAERQQQPKRHLIAPESISAPLKNKIFGQDEAIESLAELICLNRMRKKDKLLVAMLLGPTATGKSETAKLLAEVLSNVYGIRYGFIELAGSEFVGEHSVHRFFGAPPGYVGHGQPTALEAVRKNKHHVIVINEIEKADQKLIEGLMEAIDTGYLGMADNSMPIDLNQSILLFTSNLPIPMTEYITASDFQRTEICRDAFTKHCGRPEISGKIGNFIVYQALSVEATARIVIKFISSELDNYDLKFGTISKSLMHEFLDCETAYGARAIALNVSTTVGKQIQRLLLKNTKLETMDGKTVSLDGTLSNIKFAIV